MNTPRSGFRRAAIASWALAGLGAAGVAGASALAYGDTAKPAAQAEDVAVEQPAALAPAVTLAPVEPTTAELAAPPVAPAPQPATPAYTPTYTAPATQYTQAPAQTYAPAPAQTYAPAPAPAQQGPIGGSSSSSSSSARSSNGKSSSSSSSSSSSTKHVPMGSSGGPNKAVPHTVAHGS